MDTEPQAARQGFPGKTDYFSGKALPGCLQILQTDFELPGLPSSSSLLIYLGVTQILNYVRAGARALRAEPGGEEVVGHRGVHARRLHGAAVAGRRLARGERAAPGTAFSGAVILESISTKDGSQPQLLGPHVQWDSNFLLLLL